MILSESSGPVVSEEINQDEEAIVQLLTCLSGRSEAATTAYTPTARFLLQGFGNMADRTVTGKKGS